MYNTNESEPKNIERGKRMKKLLLLFIALILSGCTKVEEVSDLVKIVNANKSVEEIHIDYSIETELEVDEEAEEETGFDFDLGLDLSIDISNGITHTETTFDFFGIPMTLEQYSVTSETEATMYTNVFGEWTKEVVSIEEAEDTFEFQFSDFTDMIQDLSFEIIDPITVNGKELKQMQLTISGAQMQEMFGMDFSEEEMTEEEIQAQLDMSLIIFIGYDTETYYIERMEIDVQELMAAAPEEVQVVSIDMVMLLSKHNDIGEIVIPEEALNG